MFTEKIKKIILSIIVTIIIIFLLFNFRVFVLSPTVEIYDFEDTNEIVLTDSKYTISGTAKGSKNFYINDREILLNTDSSFSDTLYLSEYQNNFYIKSVAKTGPVSERLIQIYKQ